MHRRQDGFRVDVEDRCGALVVYRVFGTPGSPYALQAGLPNRLERHYDRRDPHGEVWDLRYAGVPAREVRQHLTAWTVVRRQQIAEYTLASATVLRSQPLKFMLSAMFLVQSPPAKAYQTFEQMGAALRWTARRLEQAGLSYDREVFAEMLAREQGNGSSMMLA